MDAADGLRVVVVGGGTTASQLALKAVRGGATEVTMVSRRKLCVRPFDCDASFAGGVRRRAFRGLKSPAERLTFCREARRGGSVSPYLEAELRKAEAEGNNKGPHHDEF